MALLLFAGSWLLGLRALAHLVSQFPAIWAYLRLSQAEGDPTFTIWVALVLAVLTCLTGGVLLLFSGIFLLIIEGTQVLVDDEGLTAEHTLLPHSLARRLGAGRLGWKQIGRLDKGFWFFVVRPYEKGSKEETPLALPTLKFLMVDQLDRLVFTILERSPNLKSDI